VGGKESGEKSAFSGTDPGEGLTKNFESFADLRGGDRKGRHEPYGVGSGGRGEEARGGQLPREVDGGIIAFRGPEGSGVEADPEEEPLSAHLRDGGMMPGRNRFADVLLVLKRALGQFLVEDFTENGEASGAGERVSAEGGAVRTNSHQAEKGLVVGDDALGNPECPDGKSTPQALGPGDRIRDETGLDGAPARHLTRAPEAALDLVEQEKEVMLPAKLPDPLQMITTINCIDYNS